VNKIGQRAEGLGLREADAKDAALLLRLMKTAFQEYEGALDPPTGAHNETIETVRRRLTAGAAAIASVDGEPVGFAFYERDADLLYFGRLSVLPEWRKKGVGTALLDYVERNARETGMPGVKLGVRLQLPHLIARYQRLGYRISTYMTHPGYEKPTFVYMEKRF